ncbi:sensor histidine kinase [Paenibacillus paridis]|uniref:sensor histidine kinase n=1 Tax=Paenibacillus paridis TaxID=2583376 RepID=UPI001123D708|nr:HAMP domain-containing sensor histidine kinase [Paenibacillus paridis]
MRTIRIRTFTLLCFFFILTLPWIFYAAAHIFETNTLSFAKSHSQNEALKGQFAEIAHLIESNTDKWNDVNWQNQLDNHLQKAKMDAVILSASDQEIFRSNRKSHSSMSSNSEKYSVLENGRILGRFVVYMPESKTVPFISMVFGLFLAFFIIGIEMRRFLLKPLERMSLAARQMAAGDWDVRLPDSRITEIAKVRDGFEVMVSGLQTSIQKQLQLEEERRFVIAAVAHDLRTPLFALRGYLDGLEQGIAQSPEKISKYITVCKEKSAQLDRLVEDLFTFTKMEYMEEELINVNIDLPFVIRTSMDSLNLLARQKHISISTDLADDCDISGDRHLLERAINNLLDNAVRHTPSNGDIEVRCYKDGSKVIFTIRDTGPGFTTEELQRVFEPLYRGETSRNRLTGGSGLGLTISQRIIRRHRGELTAKNHSEGGAILTAWIPAY